MSERCPKNPKYQESGTYELDWDALRKELDAKKENYAVYRKDAERWFQHFDARQRDFIMEYWSFLTVAERREYLVTLFPGKTYDAVAGRIKRYVRDGGVLKRPDRFLNNRRARKVKK